MKIDILVPYYKENEAIVKPLFESIKIQQNVNWEDICVKICRDGEKTSLSDEFLNSYPFKVEHFAAGKHIGVSGVRQLLLDKATAPFIMYCDADDMFANVCAISIIMQLLEEKPTMNVVINAFIEENKRDGVLRYIPKINDGTFIHGKIYRVAFLKENDIHWDKNLTLNEDSYFNSLCIKLSNEKDVATSQLPIYLWKYNVHSVTRNLNTMKIYLEFFKSNRALVSEFAKRDRIKESSFYVYQMLVHAYFKLFVCRENPNYNKALYNMCMQELKKYIKDYYYLLENVEPSIREPIIKSTRGSFPNVTGPNPTDEQIMSWINSFKE